MDPKQRHISAAPVQFSRDPELVCWSAGNSPCHFQLVYQSNCLHFTQHSVQHAVKEHAVMLPAKRCCAYAERCHAPACRGRRRRHVIWKRILCWKRTWKWISNGKESSKRFEWIAMTILSNCNFRTKTQQFKIRVKSDMIEKLFYLPFYTRFSCPDRVQRR